MGMLLGLALARWTAGHVLLMWTVFLALTLFHMYGASWFLGHVLFELLSFGKARLIFDRHSLHLTFDISAALLVDFNPRYARM